MATLVVIFVGSTAENAFGHDVFNHRLVDEPPPSPEQQKKKSKCGCDAPGASAARGDFMVALAGLALVALRRRGRRSSD